MTGFKLAKVITIFRPFQKLKKRKKSRCEFSRKSRVQEKIVEFQRFSYILILDSFNPVSKDDREKNLESNQDLLEKAIDEVVGKQLDIGIDVITDGEMSREAYFLHFVRQIQGMDADNLVDKTIRNGKDNNFHAKNTSCINDCFFQVLVF